MEILKGEVMVENKKDKFEISDEEIFREEKEFPLEGEITDALDFDSLYNLIKEKEKVKGSKQKYKAEYLISVIEETRKIFQKLMDTATKEDLTKETNLLGIFDQLPRQLSKITRKENLRFKVLQLLLLGTKEKKEVKETK